MTTKSIKQKCTVLKEGNDKRSSSAQTLTMKPMATTKNFGANSAFQNIQKVDVDFYTPHTEQESPRNRRMKRLGKVICITQVIIVIAMIIVFALLYFFVFKKNREHWLGEPNSQVFQAVLHKIGFKTGIKKHGLSWKKSKSEYVESIIKYGGNVGEFTDRGSFIGGKITIHLAATYEECDEIFVAFEKQEIEGFGKPQAQGKFAEANIRTICDVYKTKIKVIQDDIKSKDLGFGVYLAKINDVIIGGVGTYWYKPLFHVKEMKNWEQLPEYKGDTNVLRFQGLITSPVYYLLNDQRESPGLIETIIEYLPEVAKRNNAEIIATGSHYNYGEVKPFLVKHPRWFKTTSCHSSYSLVFDKDKTDYGKIKGLFEEIAFIRHLSRTALEYDKSYWKELQNYDNVPGSPKAGGPKEIRPTGCDFKWEDTQPSPALFVESHSSGKSSVENLQVFTMISVIAFL